MTYSVAHLRPVEDRAGLLELWRGTMAGRSAEDVAAWRYAWFFDQNPAGAPTSCVTRHTTSGAVVASGSAHPRPTQVAGELHSAAVMSDFVVAKGHRTAAAALAVQRRLMADSLARFDFMYGTPNKEAEPIFKRLAFHTVATTASYSRLLRTANKLESYVKPRALAGIAGAVLDRALAATDLRARVRHPLAYRAEVTSRADDRFDDLWRRARVHYDITGERSASYLNWRYADFRTREHRFFVVSERRSGRLCGYVVFSVVDDVVMIDDLFCDDPRTKLAVVLLMFASEMRDGKNRSIWLSLVAAPWYERALRRLLFIKRPVEKSLIMKERPGLPADVTRHLLDGSRWFMVGGELDT
jgi:hypothetical protein